MMIKKQQEEAAEADANSEEKKRVRHRRSQQFESHVMIYLPSLQIEKEKRKAKAQHVKAETSAMLQETPEQRADRLAAELIAEEEREKKAHTLKKKN